MLIIYFFFLYIYLSKYLSLQPKQWMRAIHICFAIMTLLIKDPLILGFYLILSLSLCNNSFCTKCYHFLFVILMISICISTKIFLLQLLKPFCIQFNMDFISICLTILILGIELSIIPFLLPKHTTKIYCDVFMTLFFVTILNFTIVCLLHFDFVHSFYIYLFVSLCGYGSFGYLIHRYITALIKYEKEVSIHDNYLQQIDTYKENVDENMVSLNKQLRHDLKNHILTLKILIKQQDPKVETYISSLKKGKDD